MLRKKMFTMSLAFIMLLTMLIPTNVFAKEENVGLYDAEFYDSENVTYIEKIPAELFSNYKDVIEEVDTFIVENYGVDYVISTSKNFRFDEYYLTIKLGVLLDMEDGEQKERIKKFADELDSIYIAPFSDGYFVDEEPMVESDESNDIGNTVPYIDASTYNVSGAVDYAREWTEEGEKLSNPNYKRFPNDCTNFVSQVLYAGGIKQIKGGRKEDSSWYYAWGIFERPSYTWGGAHNLYKHLRNHSENIARVTSTADLQVGDIISFDLNGDDNMFHIGHTVVVTGKNGNRWKDILVTYHSKDREDYSLSNLIDAGYIPYGWHIN